MSKALPLIIAALIAGALSGKLGEYFSVEAAAAIDFLIFIAVYYYSYKIFKYYRDL